MAAAVSPPPHPKNSWDRARVSPLTSRSPHPWIPLLLFLTSVSLSSSSSPAADIHYADHCSSTVPESHPTALVSRSSTNFYISGANYSESGGGRLFPAPGEASFFSRSIHRTRNSTILQVAGTLHFQGLQTYKVEVDRTRHRHNEIMSISGDHHQTATFELSGFWDETTGKLCMVGRGFQYSGNGSFSADLSAICKLNYPNTSSIFTSVVSGTLESLDAASSQNHFDPVSILAYTGENYNYEYLMDTEVNESCSRLKFDDEEPLRLNKSSWCSYMRSFSYRPFLVEHGSKCPTKNCNPFGQNLRFLQLSPIRCSEDGHAHLYLVFSNVANFVYDKPLNPERSLVAEGFWDESTNRLCLVACRILSTHNPSANASVGDCTIGLSFWFPAELSLERMTGAVGRIWSNKNVNDAGYFGMASYYSLDTSKHRAPGLRYRYTKLDAAKKSGRQKNVMNEFGKRRYPSGQIPRDLGFDISVRDSKGRQSWGYATLLWLDETYRGNDRYFVAAAEPPMPASHLEGTDGSICNVSYEITTFLNESSSEVSEQTKISAEGVYNSATGMLCLVGCRNPSSSFLTKEGKGVDSSPMDCEILINIQLPALNPDPDEHPKGFIRSTRDQSDPLYFDHLEVTPDVMYTAQAMEAVWRMDLEIVMVVISLTLSCIFTRMQLYHAKRHQDLLPSVSITMLAILTLGHMIPLVLNFEALFFTSQSRRSIPLQSGGWLEVNEVIVRVLTMVAFVIQFRLLQLAWHSRAAAETKNGVSVAERRALKLCLLLYFVGGLIGWVVQLGLQSLLQTPDFTTETSHSLLGDLMSYAGLILDGFLLPQIIFNIFWNSKGNALTPFFYVGTTVIRTLPHLYDAYRAQQYMPHLDSSYIYASPEGDFYSLAWDIIIPCVGLLFAVLIYKQQQFGGACVLPVRYRKLGGYETVPVVGFPL